MSTSSPDNFTMIPADTAVDPAADLAAAVAGAVAQPAALSVTPAPAIAPIPFGSSWVFDWEAGQFVWQGASPQQTTSEFGGLEQWCLMAVHAARYAHAVFSDEFGMEKPNEPIGNLPSAEIEADWSQNIVEALLVHDRITSVENLLLDWDPQTGILSIVTMDVVTDADDQTVTLTNVQIPIGGSGQ